MDEEEEEEELLLLRFQLPMDLFMAAVQRRLSSSAGRIITCKWDGMMDGWVKL
jgi:hypothetical protein